jgi:hypothetical protein
MRAMMKRLYVVSLVIVLVGGFIFTGCTPMQWEWQKTCGGIGTDMSFSVQQTSDGGYIIAGITTSYGAGGFDYWVIKLE